MIGLEISKNDRTYKVSSKKRSLSFSSTLHNGRVDIFLGAYNFETKTLENWLFSTLNFEDEVTIKVKEIDVDTP